MTFYPEKWARPLVSTFTIDGSPPMVRVVCWCGSDFMTLDPAVAQALADDHFAGHRRPRFWMQKLATKVGRALVQWGRNGYP